MTRLPFVITVGAVVLANTVQCAALAVATSANSGSSHHVVPVKEVFVITHAAGRMGKLLALQIKEDAEIEGRQIPTIRAVVRSEAEAMSVKCDLGGMSLAGGTATPNPLDWLETVVVDADVGSAALGSALVAAFEGATYACLCSEAHNEMVWDEDDGGCAIRVPAAESRDLSARLLAEIDAAARSPTLRHTLLRSSMGLSGPADSAGGRAPRGRGAGGACTGALHGAALGGANGRSRYGAPHLRSGRFHLAQAARQRRRRRRPSSYHLEGRRRPGFRIPHEGASVL